MKSKIGMSIFIIVLVFIGVISGVYVNNNFLQVNQAYGVEKELVEEDIETVALEPFLSNIGTGKVGGSKYISLSISVEVSGEDDATLIEEKMDRVRDSVQGYLIKQTEEDINNQEQFKNGLMGNINDSLGRNIVVGILITDRVIQ